MNHPMDPGEFIRCLGCYFYIGLWVGNFNKRNWWSTADTKMSGGVLFRLNKYMAKTRFEGIIVSLCYTDKKYSEYYDGFFHMRQMEESWNINMAG